MRPPPGARLDQAASAPPAFRRLPPGTPHPRASSGRRPCRPARAFLLALCLLLPVHLTRAQESVTPKPKPAKLKVSGFGLLGNPLLRKIARQLLGDDRQPETFSANFLEDAAVVMLNRVRRVGYLDARLTGTFTYKDGTVATFVWKPGSDLILPRPLEVTRAHFHVQEGTLYHYRSVAIDGLSVIPEKDARGFFYKTDFLLRLKTTLRFSRQGLQRSVGNLRQAVQNLGYRDAEVRITSVHTNTQSGDVEVTVLVDQGPLYSADNLLVHVRASTNAPPTLSESRRPDEPYSQIWAQDLKQELATREFAQGYPDTEIQLRELQRQTNGNLITVQLEADALRGDQVELGEVHFEGYDKTRLSLLQRKARLDGPWLDRLEVDAARERILRLGTFKYADVLYTPEEGSPRDVIFRLEEGNRLDVNLLFGYGSYDLAFGGVEVNQYNIFGLAHSARLRAVQSFKSSLANYTYTVPDLFSRDINLFVSADGLRREEVSFDREELTLSVGVRKSFLQPGLSAGIRYAYEFLDARLAPASVSSDGPNEVAAFIFDLLRERRDNPLVPRQGHRIYFSAELADPAYGGESEFQRIEMSASYHQPLGGGRFAHLALGQGLVFTPDRNTDLPFNKRFFPGGENSVRGYQRGEASPLDAAGEEIGAESAIEWNIELEQALTPIWSVVGFVDGTAIAADIDHYPEEEILWSAGGGIRWNTLIGPVRLEYGYNLDPRPQDPSGTLHFSIGAPF